MRTHQKTPKRLHGVRLTWQKPRTAPKGATRAQESRGCIGRTHARAVRSNRCENGCKNTKTSEKRQTSRNRPTHSLAQRTGEAGGLWNHADVSTARMDVQSDGNNPKTAKNVSRKVRISQGPKTHLWSSKLKWPSAPKDRNTLTLTKTTCTHRETR